MIIVMVRQGISDSEAYEQSSSVLSIICMTVESQLSNPYWPDVLASREKQPWPTPDFDAYDTFPTGSNRLTLHRLPSSVSTLHPVNKACMQSPRMHAIEFIHTE